MTLCEKIEEMSDQQLKRVWSNLSNQSWCGSDMYDKTTSMDEWGMMIVSEMDSRNLDKFK